MLVADIGRRQHLEYLLLHTLADCRYDAVGRALEEVQLS